MFLDSRQQNQEFKRKNANFARAILHQFFYASLTYLALEENGHVMADFGRKTEQCWYPVWIWKS